MGDGLQVCRVHTRRVLAQVIEVIVGANRTHDELIGNAGGHLATAVQVDLSVADAVAATQPTPPVTVNQALLASNVSCSFIYAAGASQRNAVLVVSASLTLGGETVSLFKQVHVNNVP